MKINGATFVIIFVLLLVLYLLDNIKSLEDSILSSPLVEKSDTKMTKRYFRDIKYKKTQQSPPPPPPPKKEDKEEKKDIHHRYPKEISIKIPENNVDRHPSKSSTTDNDQHTYDSKDINVKLTWHRTNPYYGNFRYYRHHDHDRRERRRDSDGRHHGEHHKR